MRVIGQGGDGGTVDIGFACLSGMFERNDDVLFICYDNEAYMNTGVQRSGATPPAARTATTKPVGEEPGNVFGQGKNVPLIAMAHEIPYVATATANGKLGIWLFLASEVMLFGALFSTYILLRVGAVEWPHGELSIKLGAINTVILICSSVTMVMAWASLSSTTLPRAVCIC